MGHIFLSPGDSHTEGLIVLIHSGLKVSLMLTLIQKGRSVSFKVTPSNDRVLCVYPLYGNSWLGRGRGRFFEGLHNYMRNKNKNEGNESKIILGNFNCTMDKMDIEMDFIDVVPIMSYQNSLRIMGSRICGEVRTRFLSSPAAIDPLAQDPG